MKTNLFVIAVLACRIIGSPLRGADNDSETHGLSNGRFWVTIEQEWREPDGRQAQVPEGSLRGVRLSRAQGAIAAFKLAFVSGVADMLANSAPQDYYFYLPKGVTRHETTEALDAFY